MHEILDADYTFLNKPLAKHYGVQERDQIRQRTGVGGRRNEFQRGGILRLGAVLTATSAPLRTSPVKRGDWVLRRILGTPTPPPPADAGSIPADDKLFGGIVGEAAARSAQAQRHLRAVAIRASIRLASPWSTTIRSAAGARTYSDGKPVDDSSALGRQHADRWCRRPAEYLRSQEPQVLKTMSYKLVGYALGRTVQASDQPLIDQLTAAGGEVDILARWLLKSSRASNSATAANVRIAPKPGRHGARDFVTPAAKETNKEGGE